MRRLVEAGTVDPARYVQVGLRGYWPGEEEFAWQAERGITSLFMHDVRELGIDAVVERAAAAVGEGPVFLSVDIDVLDPAFAPGHRHSRARRDDAAPSCCAPAACSASRLELVGAELVEVIPTAVGSADITALAAERVVREIVTGDRPTRGVGAGGSDDLEHVVGAYLAMKLGPTPRSRPGSAASAGLVAAIAPRVRLLATV